MDISALSKWILTIGLCLMILGGALWLLSYLGLPIGKLPGDFKAEKGNFFFYAPIFSSIVISIFLTVLVNLILWIARKF